MACSKSAIMNRHENPRRSQKFNDKLITSNDENVFRSLQTSGVVHESET